MTSHTNCAHPSTSSARAACRKAQGIKPSDLGTPIETSTRQARKAEPAPTAEVKQARREELNAKRLRATQAMVASKQGPRGVCHLCDGPAGWTIKSGKGKGESVCIKHVDYDNCRILAL